MSIIGDLRSMKTDSRECPSCKAVDETCNGAILSDHSDSDLEVYIGQEQEQSKE